VLGAECHMESDPSSLSTSCADPDRAAEAVGELTRSGIGVANFSLGQPSLDEVFLALTGRPAEDQTAEEATPAEEQQPA
jgi:ABC-2 type transport system ATP-binding protein